MNETVYRENLRRTWIHLVIGVGLTGVPLLAGLKGLLFFMFLFGLPLLFMAVWAVFKLMTNLSEHIRVSDEAVDYVNPVRRSHSVSLPLTEITGARFEEKKLGISGRRTEMCAVVTVKDGKALRLTERFLHAPVLEALVKDVEERRVRLGLSRTSSEPDEHQTLEEPSRGDGGDSGPAGEEEDKAPLPSTTSGEREEDLHS